MLCPSCDTKNREGRRFCAACGASLANPCPACGFENEPGETYCGGCGTAVDSPTPASKRTLVSNDATTMRGIETAVAERRQLTVMFCDLVGSTELSQKIDAEDLREVNRAYQDACKAAIERYGGYIARYMGDGVLAYFGYPQAHEDDAERAVYSGLGVVESVTALDATMGKGRDMELAVRVGIATGPVVVGDLIGEGASQESAVVGETPNLAARLQSVAAPNTVLIGAHTQRLVGGLFEYEDLGSLQLKGLVAPVQVWRAVRQSQAQSRFDAAALRGLTPLVGKYSANPSRR